MKRTRGLAILVFLFVVSCGGGDSHDRTPPTVTATNPANGVAFAYTATTVTATFSKSMDPATISAATFTIDNGITGTVTYNTGNMTATFTAAVPFVKDTTYTATIRNQVRDALGIAMAADYNWSFTAREAPTAPSGLTAVGTLNKISLSWTASSGGGLAGYRVYRSADGGRTYDLMNAALLTGTTYDDPIDSPAGDGIYYQYRVVGVGYLRSPDSDVVRQMHGTRLAPTSAAGLSLTSGGPYVAEGTVTIDGGNLVVANGIQLYLLDHSKIDLEQERKFMVDGLFRAVPSSDHPAEMTSHKGGGIPDDTKGLWLVFGATSTPYDTATGNGCLIQNTSITMLKAVDDGISIGADSGPRLYNNHISFNSSGTPGTGYLYFYAGSKALFQHNTVDRGTLNIVGKLDAAFKAEYNLFTNDFYSISFTNHTTAPSVADGQIINNQFYGSQAAYMNNVTSSLLECKIPLSGNYWPGGTGSPPVPGKNIAGVSNCDFNFTTPLSAAPAGVGASW